MNICSLQNVGNGGLPYITCMHNGGLPLWRVTIYHMHAQWRVTVLWSYIFPSRMTWFWWFSMEDNNYYVGRPRWRTPCPSGAVQLQISTEEDFILISLNQIQSRNPRWRIFHRGRPRRSFFPPRWPSPRCFDRGYLSHYNLWCTIVQGKGPETDF